MAVLVRGISDEVKQYGSIARIPATAVSNTRNDMYLASEAIRFLQEAHSLAPGNTEITAALGYAYARSGDRAKARQLLADLHTLTSRRRVSPTDFAILHTGLGQNDIALDYLEKGYQERDGRLIQLKVNPYYESLRSDPRFHNLLKRIGLDT